MFEPAWRLFIFTVVTLMFYWSSADMFYAVLAGLILIGFGEVVSCVVLLLWKVFIWAFYELQKKDPAE